MSNKRDSIALRKFAKANSAAGYLVATMPKPAPTINCADCGTVVVRTGPSQMYCQPCSDKRHQERQRKWAADHNRERYAGNREAIVAASRELSAHMRDAGLKNSESETMAWDAGRQIDLVWTARVSVPFDYALSKNAIYRTNRFGHVFMRKEAKAVRESLMHALRNAVQGKTVVQNRVWIDVFVQKPNNRGDAINVIDTVCDAAKEAIRLDDRWFSIRRLDWQITKGESRLYVGVGQDSRENVGACSCCGRLLPFDCFNAKKDTPQGIDRVCKQCRSDGRALKKANPRVEVMVRDYRAGVSL